MEIKTFNAIWLLIVLLVGLFLIIVRPEMGNQIWDFILIASCFIIIYQTKYIWKNIK